MRRATAASPLGWQQWLFLSALIAAVFLVYCPAWQGGLLWDDEAHVTRPELRSLDGLRQIWFRLGATQQCYPLLHSFFWLQYQLWGDATLGYHLTNLALHAAAVVLVALVLRRLAVPGALLAAAIFALHPVQVESVAWITEQKNTLSAVFYLAAALAYLGFDQTRRKLPYMLAVGLFVLGLLSKTVTATLPAALLLIFWWQRGRLVWKRDVLPLVPFFLLGAAAGVLTACVEHELIGAKGAEYEFTLIERLLIAGRVVWFYLGKLLWPAELIFIYPRWTVSQQVWWQYLFPLAAMVLLVLLWAIRGRTRGPLAALLFFAGTLFPVLGFFNVYPFRYSLVADHFQYLASLGIITLLSAGAALLWLRWQPWAKLVGQGLCLALLLVLAYLSHQQSKIYTDAETLFTATIKRNPACWMGHINMGLLLANLGRNNEAIAHYHEALRLKPDYVDAHNNLGNVLADLGRTDEALAQYREALRLKPDLVDGHFNLGLLLASAGRIDEAIEHYEQALRLKPDYALAHINLGNILAGLGRTEEAIAHYREALRLKPDYALAHNNLAASLAALGRIAEAIEHYHEALRLQSDDAATHNNLANALAGLGRTNEALAQYREALRLKPDLADAHHNLGVLLAGLGRTDEAIERYREALRLEPDFAHAQYNLAAALARTGRTQEAIAQYNRFLARTSDSFQAFRELAWLLATHEPAQGGDPSRAVQLAQRARALAGRENAECLDTSAAAYAAVGRFEDAVSAAERALQLAESNGQMALAKDIRSRLELYRAGRPYREGPAPSKPSNP